jgi:ABC-type multidrug transport system ATPase subunit
VDTAPTWRSVCISGRLPKGLAMLTIENLSKTYPNGVQALKGVSLEIPKGMFGLLGPNGAGKSTLMRTIATLQEPDSGTIRLGDLDVIASKEQVRRRLGYLPQEFGVYPRVSPHVMLHHLAVLKGIGDRAQRNEVVDKLLVQTNLWDVRNKNIDSFSGGMRQRFGIAQALLGDPELVIVDEPTAGLDPAERRRFHNLLARIGEDVVVILSTHIVDDVAELCPQMAIMARGEILVHGEPQALIDKLNGSLWKIVVEREAADALRQQLPVVSSRMIAGRVELRVAGETAPGEGMTPTTPTLEDVYFATLAQHGIDVISAMV